MLQSLQGDTPFSLLVLIVVSGMTRDAQAKELRVTAVLVMMLVSCVQVDNVRCTSSAFSDGELLDATMLASPVSLLFASPGQFGPVRRVVVSIHLG
jgi:hypothetical protein